MCERAGIIHGFYELFMNPKNVLQRALFLVHYSYILYIYIKFLKVTKEVAYHEV